jgi:hypothetical protein
MSDAPAATPKGSRRVTLARIGVLMGIIVGASSIVFPAGDWLFNKVVDHGMKLATEAEDKKTLDQLVELGKEHSEKFNDQRVWNGEAKVTLDMMAKDMGDLLWFARANYKAMSQSDGPHPHVARQPSTQSSAGWDSFNDLDP